MQNILCREPGRTLPAHEHDRDSRCSTVSDQLPRRKQARRSGRAVGCRDAGRGARDARGTLPLRRDLLIEHLHALNDRFGQLRTDHLAALAQLLKLSQVEVFEVASFYHHFDVVREDAEGRFEAPPALTVRVCDGLVLRAGRCARRCWRSCRRCSAPRCA